jgi:hypothetical protein
MNRRNFLKLFASAAPVAVVAPTYFFAPVGGWHKTPGQVLYSLRPEGLTYRLSSPNVNLGGECLTPEVIRRVHGLMEGISIQERLNRQIELMNDYAQRLLHRGEAQWT